MIRSGFLKYFYFFLINFLLLHSMYCQPADPIVKVAEELKPNIVAIKVEYVDGVEERGFGFVTGENGGRIFIVTAAHVVVGIDLDKTAQKIQVRFNNDSRWIDTRVDKVWNQHDLALLEITKPYQFKWSKNCGDFSPNSYQKVRFIGVNGSEPSWSSPGSGEIFEITENSIKFAIGTIRPGTSGAPLISEKGIIGLIIQDEGSSSIAIKLSKIKELLGTVGLYCFGLTGSMSVVPNASMIFKKDDIAFELTECRKAGQLIECIFKITNTGRSDTDIIIYGRTNSRIIASESGYEYLIGSIRLADKVNSYEVQKTLIVGLPIKATMTFSNVAEAVSSLSKMELHCWTKESGYFDMELRNIQVK